MTFSVQKNPVVTKQGGTAFGHSRIFRQGHFNLKFDSIVGLNWIAPTQEGKTFFRPTRSSNSIRWDALPRFSCDKQDVDAFLNGTVDTLKFYDAL